MPHAKAQHRRPQTAGWCWDSKNIGRSSTCLSVDAGPAASSGRCRADARRLQAPGQRRHRHRRSAADGRRPEARLGQRPDAGRACSSAAHASKGVQRRSSTATLRACSIARAGALDAGARHRGADRGRKRHRIDDAAGVSSALSAVTLIVPRTGMDLTVTGGFVAEQTEADREPWTVYGSPGRPLKFSWKRKIDDRRSTLPLRDEGTDHRARRTRRGGLTDHGEREHRRRSRCRARHRAGDTGRGVGEPGLGTKVADWKHEARSLTVSFLEPIATSTSMVIAAEVRAPREGIITIPIIRMPAAERETGGVAVDVIGAGEITDQQPRGVDPADPATSATSSKGVSRRRWWPSDSSHCQAVPLAR